MSEEYRKGFKDGFELGLEEGKKRRDLVPAYNPWPTTTPNFTLEVKDYCPKCGLKLTSPMGYVCTTPNCPTFLQVTCAAETPAQTTGTVNINGPSIGQINPMGVLHGKTTDELGYNKSVFHHPV